MKVVTTSTAPFHKANLELDLPEKLANKMISQGWAKPFGEPIQDLTTTVETTLKTSKKKKHNEKNHIPSDAGTNDNNSNESTSSVI
jgi:hypothetical protein